MAVKRMNQINHDKALYQATINRCTEYGRVIRARMVYEKMGVGFALWQETTKRNPEEASVFEFGHRRKRGSNVLSDLTQLSF